VTGPGPVVLDAESLSRFARDPSNEAIRGYLRVAAELHREVIVPAVVCAEVCRGVRRTREVEALLSRHERTATGTPAIDVVVTDFAMARQVGAILHASGAGSEDIVDAHVVACCVDAGGGLVLTSDEDDISRLAVAVPAVRIVTRSV